MDKLPVPDSFKLSVILLSTHSEWQHMAIVVQAVLLEDKMRKLKRAKKGDIACRLW